MRLLDAARIREAMKDLFMRAGYEIGEDVESAIRDGIGQEPFPAARSALEQIAENYEIARCERVAICQDTGMAVVFAEVGQDVHIEGDFARAVDDGVRDAYRDGFLRIELPRSRRQQIQIVTVDAGESGDEAASSEL